MKYFVAICLSILISCATQIKVSSNYNAEGFVITNLKGTNIRLFACDTLDVIEYNDAFKSKYQSKFIFDSIITDKIKESLREFAKLSVSANVYTNINFSAYVSGEKSNVDYIVRIKSIIVSKNTSYEQRPKIAASNDDKLYYEKEIEACVVKIRTEVWSVKEKKKMSEFTSVGQATISFSDRVRGLEKAVEYSLTHLINYILENRLY